MLTDDAAAASSEVPPVPDQSAPLQAIWAAAWQQAHDAARTEQDDQVDQLEDLAAATGDTAEQQLAATEEARQPRPTSESRT